MKKQTSLHKVNRCGGAFINESSLRDTEKARCNGLWLPGRLWQADGKLKASLGNTVRPCLK